MLAELNKYGFHCLISVRAAELKHSVVDKAVDQWRPRLMSTHVRDKGHYF